MTRPHPDATAILSRAQRGERIATDELVSLVYDELRRIASRLLAAERQDAILQPTALVHEAYLKLIDHSRVDWQGRTHFKAVAAQQMRRVLLDHVRSGARLKRGAGWEKVTIVGLPAMRSEEGADVLDCEAALRELAALHVRQSRIVVLRFFGGLTVEESAQALGISPKTAEKDWRMARAWLHRRLAHSDPGPASE